jgi:hypothetical protein
MASGLQNEPRRHDLPKQTEVVERELSACAPMTRVRAFDLDGSLSGQPDLLASRTVEWIDAQEWGPRIRLACAFQMFDRFRQWLINHHHFGRE